MNDCIWEDPLADLAPECENWDSRGTCFAQVLCVLRLLVLHTLPTVRGDLAFWSPPWPCWRRLDADIWRVPPLDGCVVIVEFSQNTGSLGRYDV